VPSNEDRGYVLRRVMRRAIQQGLALEMAPGFLVRYSERVRELMAGTYPELHEQREAIDKWLLAEEEGFGRTLEQGMQTLRSHIDHAREVEQDFVSAQDAFRLHDTFGFPFELTKELLAEEGLSVEEQGFQTLMDEQRDRARAASGKTGVAAGPRERAREFAETTALPTHFTGYETQEQQTTVAAVSPLASNGVAAATDAAVPGDDALRIDREAGGVDGQPAGAGHEQPVGVGERLLVKLAESPFYAAGGGQVSDGGFVEVEHGEGRARVEEVFRLGDDQALAVLVEQGTFAQDEPVLARVDSAARHATECNHTATHLLHAALRVRLGAHVRQAGSYVGPDKLRFDFSHSQALSEQELRDVEDQVNAWIALNDPVRPITTTLEEAKRLGAMALFGEKYGDVVRMVQIGDGEYSRELCGGTHVRSTAEIGVLRILSETSSAANVRRIEALTGPAAAELLREHDRLLGEIAATLRTRPEEAATVLRTREQERKRLEKQLRSGASAAGGVDIERLAGTALEVGGAHVLTSVVEVSDPKALLEIVDRLKGKLPNGAIVLGGAVDGRVHLVASVAPTLVARGVKAGAVVKVAAQVAGGGGGGRDTLAQAGGRDTSKLPEAIAAARAAIEAALED
jgi:alanyl-tRNA synthetase